MRADPLAVRRLELKLEGVSVADFSAAEAPDAVYGSMELDNGSSTGALMQAVDVLGDERRGTALPLDVSEHGVDFVRASARKRRIPGHAACPVALACLCGLDELLVADGSVGRVADVDAVGAAVVGDAAVSADASPGENDEPRGPLKLSSQLLRRCHVPSLKNSISICYLVWLQSSEATRSTARRENSETGFLSRFRLRLWGRPWRELTIAKVYGLGANALDEAAVLSIFQCKRRPLTDPLIVHVTSADAARRLLVLDEAEEAVFDALTSSFWPGGLTLVARAAPSIPAVFSRQNAADSLRL